MKILLLYNVYSDELGSSRPPLGTGYLSQVLQDAGIEHDVIDMKLGYSDAEILDMIGSRKYDCVGLTVYTVGHKKFFNFLGTVKEHYPHVKSIVGGPHITILGRRILEEYGQIDFALTGEAECSLIQFCKGEGYDKIPGLIYRKGGGGDLLCAAFQARESERYTLAAL